MGDSVTGSKAKDKSLSQGIAAGFGDQTDEDAKKNSDNTNNAGESGQSAYQTAKEMLGLVGSGVGDMAKSAADYMGLSKIGATGNNDDEVNPYQNYANKATGKAYK